MHQPRSYVRLGAALIAVALVPVGACGGGEKPAKSADSADSADSAGRDGGDEPQPDEKWNSETPEQFSHPAIGTAPSGAPASSAPPDRRFNTYDKEATESLLKRSARQVKANCGAAKDENGVAPGPWGKFTITVQLAHNGHSTGVTLPPELDGKPAGKCITQAFAHLTFPPWRGGDTEAPWPIELVKP